MFCGRLHRFYDRVLLGLAMELIVTARLALPTLVIVASIVFANSFPLPYRPPLYGVGFFIWGLSLYPIARRQRPVPLERYLCTGDRLDFSRYVLLWIGFAMLMAAISGLLLLG